MIDPVRLGTVFKELSMSFLCLVSFLTSLYFKSIKGNMKALSLYFIKVLLLLHCYLVFSTTIPLKDILTDLTTETPQTDELPQEPDDINVTQYVLPENSVTTDSFFLLPKSQEVTTLVPYSSSGTTEIEPRSFPLLINLILLPKLIIKLFKAIAFGVSAAASISAVAFLLSTIIVGLAIPGLRDVERSERNFVQEIYEHIPGEKIEAGKMISNRIREIS